MHQCDDLFMSDLYFPAFSGLPKRIMSTFVMQEQMEFKDRYLKVGQGDKHMQHALPNWGSPVGRFFPGFQCHRCPHPPGEPHVQHRNLTTDAWSSSALSGSISPYDCELVGRTLGFWGMLTGSDGRPIFFLYLVNAWPRTQTIPPCKHISPWLEKDTSIPRVTENIDGIHLKLLSIAGVLFSASQTVTGLLLA